MLAIVQVYIEDGFESYENDEQGGGRAGNHSQKAAGNNRDVHHHDASVGAPHQLLGPGSGVLSFQQIILNEGDAVTYK